MSKEVQPKIVSADGRGRTLLQMLFGWNRREIGPVEFQYHNPLKVKIGNTASFPNDPQFLDMNFSLIEIGIYETVMGGQKFYHATYTLKGLALGQKKPVVIRLIVTPDEDAENDLGHRVRVMRLFSTMAWDQGFHDDVLGDPNGVFEINSDDDDKPLEKPWVYRRVDGVHLPYTANLAVLKDQDHDGEVEENEISHSKILYWDYSRNDAVDAVGTYVETLDIEMDKKTKMFSFYRGREIQASEMRWY
jgi:hypothetical protein